MSVRAAIFCCVQYPSAVSPNNNGLTNDDLAREFARLNFIAPAENIPTIFQKHCCSPMGKFALVNVKLLMRAS